MSSRKITIFISFVLGAALVQGCVTEERWPQEPLRDRASVIAGDRTVGMERFPPRYSIDPPFGEDTVAGPSGDEERQYPIPDEATMGRYDPFKAYTGQTYYGADGDVTRHYYLDWKTGAMSTNPAVLSIRRKEGATRLRIRLRRPPGTEVIYPLEVVASIPSPSGGTSTREVLAREGSPSFELAMDIPPEIEPDSAIDLIIEVPRCVVDRNMAAISCYVEQVDQE